MRRACLLLAWGLASAGAAAEPEAAAVDRPSFDEEVVVTATAHEEEPSRLPFVTESLPDAVLRERLARTVPEALAEVAGVTVQKTAHGQGSPYLRGFTGFRTLFLIDGIRLNNSVLRDGPNQYWNTVDAFGLERLEVVQGPASVLYGSESVGGTVQALTRGPAPGGGTVGSFYSRFASAERSALGRLDLSGGLGSRWSYALGGSLKTFGDVEAGGGLSQPRTGYDEWDLDLKLRYALAGGELTAAWQQVAVDDAWRTHKTVFGRSWRGTAVGTDRRRVLDQRRTLAYLQLRRHRPSALFDSLTASLSLQRQEEERDRVRGDGRRDLQGFDVDTWGAWVRLEKATRSGTWTYGLESYADAVDSFRHQLDAAGEVTRRGIQGPVADDAGYRLWGAYAQNQVDVGSRLRLILGARYTRAEADAAAVEEPGTGERIAVAGAWDRLVGSARFVLPLAGQQWQLFGGVSQAFRAPNLSDLTRFDSARSDEIETPAPGLAPESFLAFELGVRRATPRGSFEVATFHTAIDGMIVRLPTGAVVDGDFEVTKANGGDGYSRGVTVEARTRVGRWTLFGNLGWLDGEIDTHRLAGSPVREPLDRLMPFTARFGARWRPAKDFWIEGLATVADGQDRLSTRDAADVQRIPPGGTPGYAVVTLRAGWELSERWTLSGALENLTDEDYRIHGSGLNEPGRNLVLAAEIRF